MSATRTDHGRLRVRFAPAIAAVADAARGHEVAGTQPYEEVRLLKEAGFGAIRLPVDEGGLGATLEELFDLLIALGTADSNLPQIWRNHIAFVEDVLARPRDDRWRQEITAGRLFGGAWSEIGTDSLLDLRTTLVPTAGGLLLRGTKYYSTGSIFADWISVLALSGADELSIAVVPAAAPGVQLAEDWSGIGQRQTGSGTAVFDDVLVPVADVYPFAERAAYQEAVYQLVHLATLGGIARSAQDDLVAELRRRRRAYPAGLSAEPRNDPQYHEIVGRVGALASSIEASVLWAARQLDDVLRARDAGEEAEAVDERVRQATVAVYEAQLTTTDAALEAATLLYDALGSSALDASTLLDRHWRNARTLASHNPRIYKARIVGDWHVNGADPIAALWSGHPSPGSTTAILAGSAA